MPNAALTESRDELLARYIRGNAIELVIMTLAADQSGLWTWDGPPFARLFPDYEALEDVIARLGDDEWQELWPEEDMPPDYFEAQRASKLLAAQMLIALAGASDYCSRAAQRLLEDAGAVPKPSKLDEGDDA
jgi:hypothetical protein